MKIGYARVSTEEQNLARQEEWMSEIGIDKMFFEKVSGKNMNRPELKKMLEYVREGDTLYVESISRLGRSTKDLLNIIDTLTAKNVRFVSKKENFDTSTPTGRFVLTMFAALAELEREQMLDRQREGIEIAKAQGKYKGRKEIEVDEDLFMEWYRKAERGEITHTDAMRKIGVKRGKYYDLIKKYGK